MLYNLVKKVPLEDIVKSDYKFPKSKTHAIVDLKSKNIHFICSKTYNVVANQNVYRPMEKMLTDAGFKFTSKVQVVEGTKFYVNYIIHHRIVSKHIQGLLPVMSLWNSYDGTLKTQVHFGYYSMSDENYLSSPDINSVSHASKHNDVSAVKEFDKNTIPKFFQRFKEFLKRIAKDVKAFEFLSKITALSEDILTVATKMKLSKEIKELAVEKFNSYPKSNITFKNEHGEVVSNRNKRNSWFSLYTALNYAIGFANTKESQEIKLRKDKQLFLCVNSLCV